MTHADLPPTNDSGASTPGSSDWAPLPIGAGTTGEPHPAIGQLDLILANLTSYARPVLREIAARAAELAARAGDAAGPVAHKAAEATDQAGGRLATKGREIASDLRRDKAPQSGEDTMGMPGNEGAG